MKSFYCLPKDTLSILFKFYKDRGRIENFALLLNRLIQFYWKKGDKLEIIKKIEELSDKNKRKEWMEKHQKFTDHFIKEYKNSIEKIVQKEPLSLTLSWRLVVGLGAASVYETSMTLHHIYGIPYLPGSAIKGITRSYRILCMVEELEHPNDYYERVALLEEFVEKFDLVEKNVFPKWEEVKELKVSSPQDKNKKVEFSEQFYKSLEAKQVELREFQLIFGTQNKQGCIIFFDSFPEHFEIKYDIMNPHYGPYYTEKKPPADYYNPTPIFFLALENARFTFYLGAKNRLGALEEKEYLLNKVKEWLKKALIHYGIGAKTALSYGLFKN
ncbi:MAG TPA: type III-B CRISPR module RAMP protein Cmr6 [Candidatus Atribacteria bacterium]|nr:type III-B CRISPR module RAMP protein Cmr6 [Candidatus Atribacteria bacterium]